jgi:hypothetical protein
MAGNLFKGKKFWSSEIGVLQKAGRKSAKKKKGVSRNTQRSNKLNACRR